jgi:tetratricopeptide (TPR) repeat protein
MLGALTRGVPVRDEHRYQVTTVLIQLADYYAKTGNDSDTLDNALRALQIMAHHDSDPNVKLALNRIVARLAPKLDSYDLRHFVERGSRSLQDVPEYAAALVEALQRPEIVHDPNSGDSRVREILFSVRPDLLAPHVEDLHAAAMAHLPRNPWSALEYVEVLQRLGLWDEAVKLADEVIAAVPTTIDHAPARTYAEHIRAWAQVEADIAVGAKNVKQLLEDAVTATEAFDRARAAAKTELPWPI